MARSSLAEPLSILERGRGLGRSDWSLSESVGGQRPPPGPWCSVPGSSEFHSQAGLGSGAQAHPLCPPVAVVKPRRTYSRSVAGRPWSPRPGRGACVGRRSGAWSPPGPAVKAREGGKGFGPQAGVRVSSLPLHVLGTSLHCSGPGCPPREPGPQAHQGLPRGPLSPGAGQQVWRRRGRTRGISGRRVGLFLTTRALQLFPELEGGLGPARPRQGLGGVQFRQEVLKKFYSFQVDSWSRWR